MDKILDFVKRVLQVRLKWGFSVTSWGRTVQHNIDIKGDADSLHMLWVGMDVVFDKMEKKDKFEKDCSSVGITAIYEQDHYHLQPN